MIRIPTLAASLLLLTAACSPVSAAPAQPHVDASTLTGKVMAGYQGWFRTPSDGTKRGWVHWSTEQTRIAPETISFDLWPDTSEYGKEELAPADGFTFANGSRAYLYSAANPKTVLRHFQWMRDYGIDGAWLERFVVDLPGNPHPDPSLDTVMKNVMNAAGETGRVWTISYDIAGTPGDKIYATITRDWQRLVDSGVAGSPRYLHNHGRPVVAIWGFYYNSDTNKMTPEIAGRLIDYFKAPGKYGAFMVGGGSWDWRRASDPGWQAVYKRFDAYIPWNTGNFTQTPDGNYHAVTDYWYDDRVAALTNGVMWIPEIYPGFSWSNIAKVRHWTDLQVTYSRNGGNFYWEQWAKLTKLAAQTVYIGMFDEVDEGTAIYKVTSNPPTQAHFVTYDGYPSDWYLRLTREGVRMMRAERPLSDAIPISR